MIILALILITVILLIVLHEGEQTGNRNIEYKFIHHKKKYYNLVDLPIPYSWKNDYIYSPSIQYYISSIYVINLKSSKTRWNQMYNDLQHMFGRGDKINFYHFPAIRKENGALGCLLSHLAVLDHAQHKGGKYILVLEDDFKFNVNRFMLDYHLQHVNDVYGPDFDVIQFGQYCYKWQKFKESDILMRLNQASSTSGYLIRREFIPILKKCWMDHLHELQGRSFHPEKDPLDKIQYRTQKDYVWLGFREPLGQQRKVFSTIENRMIENKWSCSDDLQTWYDGWGVARKLELGPTISVENVKQDKRWRKEKKHL